MTLNLLGGIELTEEELQQFEGLEQRAEQTARSQVDPDAVAFRRLSLIKNPTFNFYFRDADGKMTNISEIPGMDIVGLRGVLIKAEFGFGLYHEPDKRYVCQTCESEMPNGGIVKSAMPLHLPLYSPIKYNEDRNIKEPASELLNWGLKGSNFGSCHQCVLNGTNIIENQGGQPSRCGGMTSLIFCVMQVLERKTTLDAKQQMSLNFTWHDILDLKRERDSEDKIFSAPVVVNMSTGVSVSLKNVGKNITMKTQPYGAAVEGCVSLNQYLKTMQADSSIYQRAARQYDRKLFKTYATVTEVYAGEPNEPGVLNNMVHAFPVFKEAEVENPEVWIEAAHLCYNNEIQAHVNKTLGITEDNALSGVQAVPAISAVKTTAAAPKATAKSTAPKNATPVVEEDDDNDGVSTSVIEEAFAL